MAGNEADSEPIAESWDTYWLSARDGAAYSGGGTSHPLVLQFWAEFFEHARSKYKKPRIIDVASGNGAVLDCARSAFGASVAHFTCLDISASALATLEQRFPQVHGIVADARSIPLESGSYDIATSQFGIEYAGLDAIDEVVRLVAPGGELALLLHHRMGGIYRQCAASRDAIEQLQQSAFIPLSIKAFAAGFAACRGADRHAYEAAAKQLVPAIQAVEAVMKQYGTEVADGTIARLYKDVRTMHGRLPHYEPTEVLAWLSKLQGEIKAYAGRMSSMCNVAVDGGTFEKLCTSVQSQGFEMQRAEPLANPENNMPLGWVLVATRA